MANKINGIDSRSGPVSAGRAIAPVRDATSPDKKEAADAADVRITSKARQLAALEKALQEMPAVDEARVAAIRLAIENGQYAISPERIANQLMQMEHALANLPGEK